MKKKVALLLTLVMIFSLFAVGCGSNDDAEYAGTVKIGVFEPASGDNGAGGKQETLGIQYANKVQPTVDINGETYKVELVTADNESDTNKGISAAQTLVSSGVSMVLGTYGSAVAIAAGKVFKEAGMPALGITCTNPQVTEGNPVYFRICFLDPFQGTVLANFAYENGARKAYCLSKLGDDYSVGLVNYFVKAFEKLGGKVVEEQFPQGNSDFTSYVANAKAKGCDVFYSPVSIEAAALIIDQAEAQKLGMPILAGDTWDSNVVLEAAKGKDIELNVTTFYQEGGNPDFDNGIKEWINSDSTAKANNNGNDQIAAVSAMGYDAYFVALEAIKKANSAEPADILAVLPDLVYEGGVCGTVKFNETGDAEKTEAVVKHCNTETGEWEFVKTQTIEQ
ncbi:aBC-type branched-chain amino acid transport system periplasmic component [Firmicutes bacterium CAG:238]|nr:aBC-type branched-chain amino acid transport system periplasmic component [Firmicutes bacterium CAG:238]